MNATEKLTVVICAAALVGLTFWLTPADDDPSPGPSDADSIASPAANEPTPQPPAPWTRDIAVESDEGRTAVDAFVLTEGYATAIFASEPMLANPVGMSVTPQGHVYVAEAFRRLGGGVEDNRDHMYWLDDDLAAQSVEDRRAYFLRHHPDANETWTVADDRVRLIRDHDGDRVADESTVFSAGYDDLVTGIGADVLAWEDDVYFTCIPDLWRLRDRDGDGVADEQESLQHGFGVRVALFGHDLHGLVVGPDGRLYFSIGDRGYNLTTREGRRLVDPGRGAVFRCELDGSDLELFATGLRNPQDLAFDDHGNLFTVDNNSDSEDQARLVYIIEGAEIGWRMSFQYLPRRGPWVREAWWKPRWDGQATFLIPPMANLGNGPSGLACEPGTAFGEKHRGWFFLCDFLGSRKPSGIRMFRLAPKGAGFELAEDGWFARGYLPTDCEFGPDGALWSCDWVWGWSGVGKGRIYRMFDADAAAENEKHETARHLGADLTTYDDRSLGELLGHADRRVRLRAQMALASRGRVGLIELRRAALAADTLVARLHGIWGCGQLERRSPGALNGLETLFDLATEPEVLAQVAKAFGDARRSDQFDRIRRLAAAGPTPRAQAFAAIALGKLGDPRAIETLFGVLRANDDADLYLRHACVVGLEGIGNVGALLDRSASASIAERRGAVLALRRLREPRIAAYLDDADAGIAAETARAIYDVPIPFAMARLAARIDRAAVAEPLGRRAVAACEKTGDVAALAAFAANEQADSDLRVLALRALTRWSGERSRDLVLGESQQFTGRRADAAGVALEPCIERLLRSRDGGVVEQAAMAATTHRLSKSTDDLLVVVRDGEMRESARIAALRAIHALEGDETRAAVEAALASHASRLRGAAADVLSEVDPELALTVLGNSIEKGSIEERKLAIDTLARMEDERADLLLLRESDRLLAGLAPAAAGLEIIEASRKRSDDGVARFAEVVAAWEKSVANEGKIGPWLLCTEGGDAGGGERVFRKAEASCARCHARELTRETMAGPMISDVGLRLNRRELLHAIVDPSAVIAEGFESFRIDTAERSYHGRILSETPEAVVVQYDESGETTTITLSPAAITGRAESGSGMPSDVTTHLTRREIRDLVEYLTTLRTTPEELERAAAEEAARKAAEKAAAPEMK